MTLGQYHCPWWPSCPPSGPSILGNYDSWAGNYSEPLAALFLVYSKMTPWTCIPYSTMILYPFVAKVALESSCGTKCKTCSSCTAEYFYPLTTCTDFHKPYIQCLDDPLLLGSLTSNISWDIWDTRLLVRDRLVQSNCRRLGTIAPPSQRKPMVRNFQ